MLYLYDENFSLEQKAKNSLKKFLGRDFGGPKAVFESLRRGLTELDEPFVVNKKLIQPIDVACVLSGTRTLQWAIKQKQRGLIKKIVAGPNIAVLPSDNGGLILSPEINSYLVPAQWSKDCWASLNPEFGKKIRLWPAGVTDQGALADPKGYCQTCNCPPQLSRALPR